MRQNALLMWVWVRVSVIIKHKAGEQTLFQYGDWDQNHCVQQARSSSTQENSLLCLAVPTPPSTMIFPFIIQKDFKKIRALV